MFIFSFLQPKSKRGATRDTGAATRASLAARSSKSPALLFPSDDEGGAGYGNGNGEDEAVQKVSSQKRDVAAILNVETGAGTVILNDSLGFSTWLAKKAATTK